MFERGSLNNTPFVIDNRLLAALPDEELQRVVPHLETAKLGIQGMAGVNTQDYQVLVRYAHRP